MLSINARLFVDYARYHREFFRDVIPVELARPRVWDGPIAWFGDALIENMYEVDASLHFVEHMGELLMLTDGELLELLQPGGA
ncbi:MAG: hypothetical protein B7Z80_19555 [Rhodospirillales bacterium 20-64-7]|nr:MAG: hypothetical protein B7Z80_19555 [Rhodospirillales bacterium 20-64-7]